MRNEEGTQWKKENVNCTNQEWLDKVYDKLLTKMRAECQRVGANIPYTTDKDGKYHDITETRWGSKESPYGVNFWTNGFWPGLLWQMYEATGDEAYKTAAVGVEERLGAILSSSEAVDHDVGFLFLPSAVANYRKTGDAEARRRGLLAASLLASRYNLDGKFIRAWNGSKDGPIAAMFGGGDIRGWMIIDCMMNLPLLYWASEELDDLRRLLPDLRVVAGVFLELAEPGVIGAVGHYGGLFEDLELCNGVGQTALLRILTGVLRQPLLKTGGRRAYQPAGGG